MAEVNETSTKYKSRDFEDPGLANPGLKSTEGTPDSGLSVTAATKVHKLFEQGEEAFKDATDKVEDFANKKAKEAVSIIKKYPLGALALGLGVGYTIGILFRRKI